MNRISSLFQGSNLRVRAIRSSVLTVGGFGASQVIRLASNLILTRLLFPEAFGMMALVMVFIQGLYQFSDVGVGPAIMQSKRGDDPHFLNTAWTIQAGRGVLLWLAASVLAYPMALIYGEAQLMQLLPVAALTLVIQGFNPTRLMLANRHLQLGRVTSIDIVTQLSGIVSAVVLAYLTQSVWALVFSSIISSLVQLVLFRIYLEGHRDRFEWERPAAHELINFGKWIFLSTLAGFLFNQSDKMLLGKYLPLDQFGVYNIGFFLASFPLLLGISVTHKMLIPIYRERPPSESAENFAALRKMRFVVSGGLLAGIAILALVGVPLVELLYDSRYYQAGAIVVIIACMQVPQIIVLTYDQAALAAGDSKRFFVLAATRAIIMLSALFIALETYGLVGALFSIGLAMLVIYPVVVWLARHMGAWDPLHDISFAILGLGVIIVSLWVNWGAIAELAQVSARYSG
ncbi:MAG: oligosaccharide flippase family protein [Planktotalea sp.]|uniref:oligosaccharide flippase family protein n=1 Tax=Planktotalea sp. TaxID=2029877 RepID=UPI0026259EE8|nr:oligosaccharide flippase family protein [Planktotalea sp.]MDG1077571.1 oligosaccharide flippase family protein [Planktotalea sp.]